MLKNQGIGRILKELVVPRVKDGIGERSLDFLREHWQAGELPDLDEINEHKIAYAIGRYERCPFLDVDKQYRLVNRWTTFAGIWFEEIEPWANEKGG